MVDGHTSLSLSKRAHPPSLDEDSILEAIEEQADSESLMWTFTPNFMSSKDGHSRCFVSTAKPKTRKHALHLVREFELEPSGRNIDAECEFNSNVGTRLSKKALEIRVREADLRKCGDNLDLLNQYALPSEPPVQSTSRKLRRSCKSLPEKGPVRTARSLEQSRSAPSLGSMFHSHELHLPTLTKAAPSVRKSHYNERKQLDGRRLSHHCQASYDICDWQYNTGLEQFGFRRACVLRERPSLTNKCALLSVNTLG